MQQLTRVLEGFMKAIIVTILFTAIISCQRGSISLSPLPSKQSAVSYGSVVGTSMSFVEIGAEIENERAYLVLHFVTKGVSFGIIRDTLPLVQTVYRDSLSYWYGSNFAVIYRNKGNFHLSVFKLSTHLDSQIFADYWDRNKQRRARKKCWAEVPAMAFVNGKPVVVNGLGCCGDFPKVR